MHQQFLSALLQIDDYLLKYYLRPNYRIRRVESIEFFTYIVHTTVHTCNVGL